MAAWAWVVLAAAALVLTGLGAYAAGRRRSDREDRRPRIAAPAAVSPLLEAVHVALDALPDAGVVTGRAGRVLVANAAGVELTGAAPGKPLAATLRNPAILQAIERVQAGGSREMVAFTLAAPVERTIEAHVARLDIEAGRDVITLTLLRDVTMLSRIERMRADFVANASHELRTPLTSLSGFIETIRGPARDDPAAQARFLEIMQTQAERMRRLIDDLLSLSRIELNEHVRPTGASDLAAIVRDVVDAAQPQLARYRLGVDLDMEEGLPSVRGDRDELAQILNNLLENAIKYGADGGRIAIGLRRAGDMVACSVADQGEGIAREHIPRLTERFYRVDAKASRERGGTGLGLAIVKHILNRCRGRLEIESEPGKGSRFTVLLPAASS